MLLDRTEKSFLPLFCLSLCLLASGCSQNPEEQRERDAKTRDEAAKAAERAKPVIEEAGRKLHQAAQEAEHDLKAASQGAREGWQKGPHPLVDVNHASESDLASLPGSSRPEARRIIEGRPYQSKDDLVTKGIVSESEYEKIRDRVTTK